MVDEEEEWEAAIPRRKRMALISQSTQPPWKFEQLAAFMVSRAHELKIVNTVCPVTIRRQQDTLEAAGEVDLMVVVGGRSSANTKELTRLCEIAGTPRSRSRTSRDLTDPAPFDDAVIVGVTGGTSTPIEDLRDVTERIYEMAGTPETQREGRRAGARRPRPRRDAGRPHDLAADAAQGRRPGRRVGRSLTRGQRQGRAARSSPSSAGRTSARARSSTGSSASARRSSRTAPARRVTACTATPSGTAGASSSSTPAASSSTPTTRSRHASRSRPAWRSPRPTSSCSSSTRSPG